MFHLWYNPTPSEEKLHADLKVQFETTCEDIRGEEVTVNYCGVHCTVQCVMLSQSNKQILQSVTRAVRGAHS